MGRCWQLWQCTRHVQTVCPTRKGGYLSAEEVTGCETMAQC